MSILQAVNGERGLIAKAEESKRPTLNIELKKEEGAKDV